LQVDFILLSGSLTIASHSGGRAAPLAALAYRDLRMQLQQRSVSLDFTMQVPAPAAVALAPRGPWWPLSTDMTCEQTSSTLEALPAGPAAAPRALTRGCRAPARLVCCA